MRKIYIHNVSSISAQGFHKNETFPSKPATEKDFSAKEPNYKEVIPHVRTRRMGKISRMAISCAETLEVNKEELDGIIIGTGWGPLTDTINFLEEINTKKGGLLAPTAFSVSSHNTIAGQLALMYRNHGYNMTHSHGPKSFFNALLDASLQLNSEMSNILLGTVEERHATVEDIAEKMGCPVDKVISAGEGSTFFHLSTEPTNSGITIEEVVVIDTNGNPAKAVKDYCKKKNTAPQIFTDLEALRELNPIFYTEYSGTFDTASSLGFHLAFSQISKRETKEALLVIKTGKHRLGLIYMGHE